jgi:Periplasmic binding protein
MRMSDLEQNGGDGSFGRARSRSRAGGRLLRIGAGVASVAALAVSGGCSLIVDTNANQCNTLSDCTSFPGFRSCPATGTENNVCVAASAVPTCKTDMDCATYAGATCDATAGTCTRPCTQASDCGGLSGATCGSNGMCSFGPGTGCSVNADCASAGTYGVCRKSKCVSLTSPLCTTVHTTNSSSPSTAYEDDNAVIFGAINPTGSTIGDAAFGHLVEDSIKLAIDDFGTVSGLPSLTAGGMPRPIVLVGCNDGPNEDQTDVAAEHLINDLGVPAIIGYPFSGNTLTVAQMETIPNKVLLFSPSATSAQITALESTDSDLVWRTCPSDNVQAQALALYYSTVQAAALHRYPMIDPTAVKVAIVNHSDAYGSGLGDTLEGTLTFNGMSATSQGGPGGNYLRVDYGPSGSPDTSAPAAIAGFAPDIIFLFGFNEGPDFIFTNVEQQWGVPIDGHRPFWVFSDGGEDSSLWASSTMPAMAADITTEDERERVSGSAPGVLPSTYPPFNGFLTEFSSSTYKGDGSADTLGPAGAYDILYLLAYSTVMVGNNPLTGPNLVKYGLSLMKKPPPAISTNIQINRDNILTTFSQLGTGMPIDVSGVSGPLPFTGKGDLTTADIQVWCVPPSTPPDADIGGAAINSGYYFDSTSQALAGCMTGCNLPDFVKPVSCQ